MALKHAQPGEVISLVRGGGSSGQPDKTAAVVKTSNFEAVRLVVKAGSEIPPHKVSGPITLQCLSGCAVLGWADQSIELRSGDWTYLEGGMPHWVKGVEDAVLLLTILFAT